MDSLLKVWDYSVERKRLKNLRDARFLIRRCETHKVLVDYIPGHIWYNWGEYPAERCPMPDEQDEKNFKFYKEKGMGLIKFHEEWNDAEEIFDGDKFTPNNEEGFRKMISLAHENRLKFIPYISSGYYDRRSKNFKTEWLSYYKGKVLSLDEGYFNYALCSPRSPDWRAFLLNNIERLFDRYEIDGLYDDVGYDPLAFLDPPEEKQGHINAFEESDSVHGAFEDLIQEIYTIVKRYRGIFTLHAWEFCNPDISFIPRFKCWDYLYVGEGIRDMNLMRKTVKRLPEFVFYIPDWRVVPVEDQNKIYALTIPYLQFPVLYHGRPIRGKMYKGTKLQYNKGSLAVSHPDVIQQHYLKHPDDFPVYSPWDSVPGNPKTIENYFHYFEFYKEMTKPSTHVFMDIKDESITSGRKWPNLVLTAYVSNRFYLVIANFMNEKDTISLRQSWKNIETGEIQSSWEINPFEVKILEKIDANC
ncbi:MAG TPA: hypothetical protein PKK91_00720 [bacterium]|nr:hypothetical protein [bacterium]